MKRINSQDKQPVKMIRLLVAVGIVLYVCSLIGNLYILFHSYSAIITIFQLLVIISSFLIMIVLGSKYDAVVSNNNYLQAIMKQLLEGVVVCNHKEEIMYANDVAEQRILQRGFTKVQDIYENCTYLNMDGTPIAFQDRPVAKALRGEIVQNRQLCVNNNGKDTYVLVNATPFKDNNGTICGAIEVFHDITDYKAFERASINRNRAYYNLVENVNDLISAWDKNWNVLYASPTHQALLGFDHLESVGQSAFIHIHPEDIPRIRERFDSILAEKKGIQIEFRYLHVEGHSVAVEAKAEPILDQNNEVESVVIIARDVTSKIREQKLLHGQNKVLALIAREASIEDVFAEITLQVEILHKNVICGITMVNGNQVTHVSPSMPADLREFTNSLRDIALVEKYLYTNISEHDVMNDPILWPIHDRLSHHLFSATWYRPIHAADGTLIGLFGLLYKQQNEYNQTDVELCDAYAQIAAMALERNQSKREIEHLAYHDPLTGLPNRRVVEAILQQINASATPDTRYTVMMLDIDRFKWINDTFGHDTGDRLIQVTANRLLACVGKNDVVSRIGGDEFTIILCENGCEIDALQIGKHILQTVQETVHIDVHEFNITTSIGIAFYPAHGTNLSDLLKNADAAMYNAKTKGRNAVSVYALQMNEKFHDRLMLERDIHKAIENQEFILEYQPKINIGANCITGVEALIRWIHPKRGRISPGEFIHVAEEMGLIVPIGQWVFETVLQQLKLWEIEGKPRVPIAVNASAQQLVKPIFFEFVRDLLHDYDVKAELLEIEITETALMTNLEVASKNILELSRIGVSIVLDDFGTGYSSLSFLNNFEISTIKIDRSFVEGLQWRDATCENILISIISLGQSLGIKVVAEGVETEEQLQFLKDLDCDEVQGYFFSRPVPVQKLEAMLIQEGVP